MTEKRIDFTSYCTAVTVGQQPVVLTPDDSIFGFSYLSIYNGSPPDGPSLWCTRVPGLIPAPNLAGCYEISPGAAEIFDSARGYVPVAPTVVIAEFGSCPVAVERRYGFIGSAARSF